LNEASFKAAITVYIIRLITISEIPLIGAHCIYKKPWERCETSRDFLFSPEKVYLNNFKKISN
jgi:hypothetical protein